MAGARVEKKLTTLRVKALREPGTYEDGGGLRSVVAPSGARRWVLGISINGQRIERGLGAFPDVWLEAARLKATEIRTAAKSGVDVRIGECRRLVAGTTFRQVFKISFSQREKQLSNANTSNNGHRPWKPTSSPSATSLLPM